MTINQLKSLLSRFNIRPNKLMGQNFLLSEEALDKIVEAGELNKDDLVLEIGPGLGVLTIRLAERAGKVLAVEKDRKIYQALRKILKRYKNIKLVNKDALFITGDLRFAICDLEETSRQSPVASRYKVIANIPYYLTGKIIQNFLTVDNKPKLMVLLLQKEVAERLTAHPGEMSLLSVSTQFYSDPEIIALVGKENFYPEPQVDSAIVKLKVLQKPRFEVDEKKFFQSVKIGFSGRRKQLHNNLATGFGAGDYKKMLTEIGLNPLVRAQDLSLEQWHKLYLTMTHNL